MWGYLEDRRPQIKFAKQILSISARPRQEIVKLAVLCKKTVSDMKGDVGTYALSYGFHKMRFVVRTIVCLRFFGLNVHVD